MWGQNTNTALYGEVTSDVFSHVTKHLLVSGVKAGMWFIARCENLTHGVWQMFDLWQIHTRLLVCEWHWLSLRLRRMALLKRVTHGPTMTTNNASSHVFEQYNSVRQKYLSNTLKRVIWSVESCDISSSMRRTMHGRESNSPPVDHKSDVPNHYTTKPPSVLGMALLLLLTYFCACSARIPLSFNAERSAWPISKGRSHSGLY